MKIEAIISGVFFDDGKAYPFAGLIFRDSDGNLSGKIHDKFGESDVSDVSISFLEISFVKVYENGTIFKYLFGKNAASIWYAGGYKGREREGFARCVINKVEDGENFLKEPTVEASL